MSHISHKSHKPHLSFWNNLSRPFLVLAPMDDVTDVVFREIVTRTARPDVFFTEFANCDALISAGRESQINRLKFTNNQHPIVAQIWGIHPESFTQAAKLIVELGFDGIDINMGCPQRDVLKCGAGAALIDNPDLAKRIITATKKGAGNLPLSVKTRLGVKSVKTEDWIECLLRFDLAAITIHGRMAKDMSKVPANWEEIGRAVKLRNRLKSKTLIIGNGDVKDYSEAVEKYQKYHVDGVMIGRGIFEDLYAFDKSKKKPNLTPDQRLNLLFDHVKLFDRTWGRTRNFAVMKKFFKIYIRGFSGASDLRVKLMSATSSGEVEKILSGLHPLSLT